MRNILIISLILLSSCKPKQQNITSIEAGDYTIVITKNGTKVVDVNTALIPDIEAIQAGTHLMCFGTGSSKVQECAMMPALGKYTNGMIITYCPGTTNTGTQSINIDKLGAINILRNNGSMLNQDDLYIGRCYQLMYQELDKTFRLLVK